MKTDDTNVPSTPLSSLENLRIFAAIAVVLAHSSQFQVPLHQPFIGGTVFLGSLGVDIFFVISGYVMGVAASKARPGVKSGMHFFVSRMLRLVPLYTLVTIAVYCYLTVKGRPVETKHLIESLLFLPSQTQGRVLDPIVDAGWTLRFEMFFYLLISVGISFGRRLLVPILGIAAAVVAWLWNGFYFGAPVVLEFIAGYVLYIYRDVTIFSVRTALGYRTFFLGMLFACTLLLLASTGSDFGERDHGIYSQVPRLWIVYTHFEAPRIIAWGIPAFILVYFCLGLEKDIKWRLARFGKYTYGVYLLQYIALLGAGKINKLSWMPDTIAFGLGLIFLAIASRLSFQYIESPPLKWKRKFPTMDKQYHLSKAK